MADFSKYIVYVDESGDANWKATPEFPLLCLNYCLFEKDHYLHELVPRFNRLKFKYWGCDNIVLHERDLRKPDKIKDPAVKSKYMHLNGKRRGEFMDELTELMRSAQFQCFCVVIDKLAVPDRHKSFDPYHIGLSRGFRQIESYLKVYDPIELSKDLHIVFESRGRDDDAALSKAYKQVSVQGSLLGQVPAHNFSNFRLELMDKKSNSTGLQIADLTARPIGNHYLHKTGQRPKTDQRTIEVLLGKLLFCFGEKCVRGDYDVFHERL
ncbi:MAG: DUF3800 domain-containing protein [Marivivens sp.]|nr:DUF3800 domain-containing protein [Marivivens sp.]